MEQLPQTPPPASLALSSSFIKVVLCFLFLVFEAAAGTAGAGEIIADETSLDLKIGAIPSIRVQACGSCIDCYVTVANDGEGGHVIVESANVFQTTGYLVQPSALEPYPLIDGLTVTLAAGSGSYGDNFLAANPVGPGNIAGFGGFGNHTGVAMLQAGGYSFSIPLNVLGASGVTTVSSVLDNTIRLQGAPFGTQSIVITGISTNVLYVPSLDLSGAAFTLNLNSSQILSATEVTAEGDVVERHTVTVNGYNDLMSASQVGAVMMVSPFRIETGELGGNIPGVIRRTFSIKEVPEPAMNLLILSGAFTLVGFLRYRMRS